MPGMMNWEQLLSDTRCGSTHQSTTPPQKDRNEYDKDYGRVLSSAAFRIKRRCFPWAAMITCARG